MVTFNNGNVFFSDALFARKLLQSLFVQAFVVNKNVRFKYSVGQTSEINMMFVK